MNAVTRMSAVEIPFLRILPTPTPTPDSSPYRPPAAPQAIEEKRRLADLRQILDSMAADMSPRHWGINE